MKKVLAKILLLALSTIFIDACSSLERVEDVKNHHLSAQVSTKTQVVNAIGLPRTIEKDREKDIEIWYYTGRPLNTSYFVPVPVAAVPYGGGLSMVHYLDMGKKLIDGKDPIILTLVFDKAGRLIQLMDPSSHQ